MKISEETPMLIHRPVPGLTERQGMTAWLVVLGYLNKEIGNLMNISIKTVEKHRQSVYKATGAHCQIALIRYFLCQGIVSVTEWIHYKPTQNT